MGQWIGYVLQEGEAKQGSAGRIETLYIPYVLSCHPVPDNEPPSYSINRLNFTSTSSFNMSDLKATVQETKNGFHVEGYEKIEYDFTFLDNVFSTENSQLADCYKRWGRCLAIMDLNIYNIYGKDMQKYFDHYNMELKIHKTMIGEKAKSIETFLNIVDSMTDFGIVRKEPVLVVVSYSYHQFFAQH